MTALENLLESFFKERAICFERVGVAVSGGLDSIVLLDLVKSRASSIGFEPTILHLDHGLREDSGEDRRFVEGVAQRSQLPFLCASIEEPLEGPSIENAAREARYEFLRRAARELRLDAVLTAHTADDQVETILFRLLRGTGRAGLRGIRADVTLDGLRVLRPLLGVSKAELLRHAESHGLVWREDSTNDALRFRRNRIRHQVLPFLREHLNPRVEDALLRFAEIIESEEEWLSVIVEESLKIWEKRFGGFAVSAEEFNALPAALRARQVMEILSRLGASTDRESVERILKCAEEGSRLDLRGDFALWRDGEELVLGRTRSREKGEEREYPVASDGVTEIPEIGLRVTVSVSDAAGDLARLRLLRRASPRRSDDLHESAYIDSSSIVGDLVIRARREGDRITPFGMKGSKKLQDIFTDEKISLHERSRWPILCDESGILWVVGIKLDERTRVKNSAGAILRVDVSSVGRADTPENIA